MARDKKRACGGSSGGYSGNNGASGLLKISW